MWYIIFNKISKKYKVKSIKLFLMLSTSISFSETLEITFRYIKGPNDSFERVFVPGTMPSGTSNDWGPNNNGMISPNALSEMIYNPSTDSYEKSYNLDIGSEHEYKFHFHFNNSGTDNSWISDPLNPNVTNDAYGNSILNISDPIFFQPKRHTNSENNVEGFSMGLFSSEEIQNITYYVGDDTLSGNDYLNPNGVLYIPFSNPLSIYDPIWVNVTINNQDYVVFNEQEIIIIEEPIPDGIKLGPNWFNNTMYLSVFAPSQPFMRYQIGAPGFDGELVEPLLMKKDPNEEDLWWAELDLPTGHYEYQYVLPGGVVIADPLSRRISNDRTRIEIGPGGVTTADNYIWESNEYIRPLMDTLVIYELHIDDFSAMGNGQGRFEDIIEKLDHLKSTGINAIELLPIYEFPGNHSWGYDPILISSLESNYGTPFEFKKLVDEAHKRGIAIILDIIWNHIRPSSPLWEIQPDYNLNPYVKLSTELNPNEAEGSWGMLDLDHFNPRMIDYINQVNNIWVEEYKIDGFRFDAMFMIGWDLQQPEYGIPAWSSTLKNSHPDIYQIAEHLPSNPWLIENTDLSSGWHDSFHDRLKDDIHGQFFSTITYMRQVIGLHEYSNWDDPYENRLQAVKYMVSHDEQSLIQEMVTFNDFTPEQARIRDKFYATLLFTSQGVPMIFQGQEFGLQTGWTDDNNNGNYDEEKLQYRPIDWSFLDTQEGQEHLSHYKKLIKLRKMSPAIAKGDFFDLYRYTNQNVIVYGYSYQTPENYNDQIVVIANFSSLDRVIENVPFFSSGTWYNVLEPNENLILSSDSLGEYFIEAKSAIAFSNQNLNLKIDKFKLIPDKIDLIGSYPNPFNGQVIIKYYSESPTKGTINIFDLSGRLIFSSGELSLQIGHNSFEWNGQSQFDHTMSTGVYIVSIKVDDKLNNHKILYLK